MSAADTTENVTHHRHVAIIMHASARAGEACVMWYGSPFDAHTDEPLAIRCLSYSVAATVIDALLDDAGREAVRRMAPKGWGTRALVAVLRWLWCAVALVRLPWQGRVMPPALAETAKAKVGCPATRRRRHS